MIGWLALIVAEHAEHKTCHFSHFKFTSQQHLLHFYCCATTTMICFQTSLLSLLPAPPPLRTAG